MIQPPRRNLPPDAEPWGRWVEGLLLAQSQSGEANGQSINNTLRGVNASLQQLGNQIQTLSAQQATLSAQQADITALLGDQVTGSTGYNFFSTISPALTGTPTDYATVTLIVPAGYTKASVIGVSFVNFEGTNATTATRTRIAGTTSTAIATPVAPYGEAVSSSYATSLSGLSAGGTITVATQLSISAGTISSFYTGTTAFAMFFK